jgi:menaquinone-dependent protoporphyrinogen oxidase
MRILVAYDSAHGSTRDIAYRIAASLRTLGLRAEAGSTRDVRSVRGFDAFVLGSAVHAGEWLPGVTAFLRANAPRFDGRPVWLFDVGLAPAMGGTYPSHTRFPEAVAHTVAETEVRDYHRFAGAIAKGDLSWTGRLSFRRAGGRYGDFRDWHEIDAWAARIGRALDRDASDIGGSHVAQQDRGRHDA